MCNVYNDLDKLTGLFSMDWGLLGTQVTNAAVYLGYEAKDILLNILENMGNDCQDEAIEAVERMLNEGILEDANEYLNEGEDTFDVERLKDVAEEAGLDLLDCVLQDINLYNIGNDVGQIMSRILQS